LMYCFMLDNLQSPYGVLTGVENVMVVGICGVNCGELWVGR
jgi:hypothetical protein